MNNAKALVGKPPFSCAKPVNLLNRAFYRDFFWSFSQLRPGSRPQLESCHFLSLRYSLRSLPRFSYRYLPLLRRRKRLHKLLYEISIIFFCCSFGGFSKSEITGDNDVLWWIPLAALGESVKPGKIELCSHLFK